MKLSKKEWPGEGDSNPRKCYLHQFSRLAHSTALTSPGNVDRIISQKDKKLFNIVKILIIL